MTEKGLSLEKQYQKLQSDLRLHEKRVAAVNKEKESLQRELNKSILLQEKLKDVCREQQKLIKSISNERLQQIQKEEQRHKENQEKFQNSLDEINKMLAKNNEENIRLRNENIEMTQQLLSLTRQCDTREQQVKGIESKIEIDTQLNEAKLKKIQIEYAIEKETLFQQKEVLSKKLLEADAMLKDFRDRETVLNEQIEMYSNKYEGFQSAIQRSNEMFDKYKKEIETMSRNTRKLEKELMQWKKKYEQCNATLISITTERKGENAESIKCAKQLEQLKKLLRTLHVERTALYKILSENNIETPNVRHLIPEGEIVENLPNNTKSNTLEVVMKSCADLKDSLPEVQEKMK